MRVRLTLRRALRAGAAASVAAAALAGAATASAAPQLVGLRFVSPPTIGRTSQLEVQATNPGGTIGELSVAFGGNDGVFGIGACRPPDSQGRPPGGAFAPGATSTFRIPHVFRTGGARPVLLLLHDGGGCSETGSTLAASVTVTPNAPGSPPAPLPAPVIVPLTGANGGSLPPQTPQIPSIQGVPSLPGLPSGLPVQVPGAPTVPSVPGLPSPPVQVPSLPKALAVLASASRGCRFANRVPAPNRARSLARARAAVLCLLNAERRAFGEGPLRLNRALTRAAGLHDASMVRAGFFSHVDPGGVTLVDRLRLVHYITATVHWSVGENLGYGVGGASTPAALVQAWMNSAEHRANILYGPFRQIGIAIDPGVPGAFASGLTYTTDFGVRT